MSLFASLHDLVHLIQMLLEIFRNRMLAYDLYVIYRTVDAQRIPKSIPVCSVVIRKIQRNFDSLMHFTQILTVS